jgi:hypothetical protein
MFVGMEMKLALMSFNLISSIPHQMPGLLGMSPAGRVDMEGFGSDTTGTGLKPVLEEVTSATRGAISAPESGGSSGRSLGKPEGDSTLSAQTTVVPPAPERE